MTAPADIDPFAGGTSTPSLSFKDEPVGTVKTIEVVEPAKMAQSRDYDSGDPLYWVPGQAGKKSTQQSDSPVMAAVVTGIDANGDLRAVWAQKPSALFSAIAKAQNDVKPGYRIKAGDKLAIKYTGEEPSKSGRGNPKKLWAAKVTPAAEADPFAAQAAAPPATSGGFGDEPPFHHAPTEFRSDWLAV